MFSALSGKQREAKMQFLISLNTETGLEAQVLARVWLFRHESWFGLHLGTTKLVVPIQSELWEFVLMTFWHNPCMQPSSAWVSANFCRITPVIPVDEPSYTQQLSRSLPRFLRVSKNAGCQLSGSCFLHRFRLAEIKYKDKHKRLVHTAAIPHMLRACMLELRILPVVRCQFVFKGRSNFYWISSMKFSVVSSAVSTSSLSMIAV